MYHIDTIHINEKNLDACYYFSSLLEEAQNKNLLFKENIIAIQNQLLLILEQQVELLTEGKSSSLSMEKAHNILESICYVIGYQLKTMSPMEAIVYLKEKMITDIFQQGLSLIQLRINELQIKHQQLVHHLLSSENVFYKSTIVDGIHGFFQLYDPRFEAQEIHITVDYPTCLKRPHLLGIEFIDKYLNHIEIENEFCLLFDEMDIHHLLCGLIQDYRHVFLNIYEFVLLSVVGLILVKKNGHHLDLTKQDIDKLYSLFNGKTKQDIFILMKKAYLQIHRKMKLSQNMLTYTTLCLYKLSEEIKHALSIKTLDKLFLVPFYQEDLPSFSYSYGQKMDDQHYQSLIDNLSNQEDALQRTQFILKNVTSLADFLDLLHDISFQETELSMIIEQMSLIDLAILIKQFPQLELLENENERLLYHVIEKRKKCMTDDEKRQLNVIIEINQRN